MKQEIWHGDCLELMKDIPDKSVDMILCDLPYGTTACKRDTIIPFDKLWEQYLRIVKDDAAILLFGSEPFSSVLRVSNLKHFRYDWIWKKDKSGNIAVLKYQPAKVHEIVSVFSIKSHKYNPIMDIRLKENKRNNKPRFNKVGIQGGKEFFVEKSRGMDDVKYPISVREYNCVRNGQHPTQKPVELLEYLIKTYTQEKDLVLDNCAGSGSTLVAAKNLNRQFIGIEKEKEYYDICLERLKEKEEFE